MVVGSTSGGWRLTALLIGVQGLGPRAWDTDQNSAAPDVLTQTPIGPDCNKVLVLGLIWFMLAGWFTRMLTHNFAWQLSGVRTLPLLPKHREHSED